MVTGASNVDLAIVLIDARTGVIEQTRRHALLASLLGVPHLVICVNKMDLVGYSETRFEEIRAEFEAFAAKIRFRDVTFIPVSALAGDNVVDRSANMPWYQGYPLLGHLETVYTASDRNLVDARFPVQYVIRPQHNGEDYRGYAGRIAAGTFRVGETVTVLPSGLETTIVGIDGPDGELTEATAGQAVTLRIGDDISINRGDLFCRPANQPTVTQQVDAMVAWMSQEHVLRPGRLYAIKHTTRQARAKVTELRYRLDVSELHREPVAELGINDIGRVSIHTTLPLLCDPYERNRSTGSFLLIEESTGETVGAGMVLQDRA